MHEQVQHIAALLQGQIWVLAMMRFVSLLKSDTDGCLLASAAWLFMHVLQNW